MNAPAAYLPRATGRDKRIDPPRAYGRYAIAVRLRDAVVGTVGRVAASMGHGLGRKPTLMDFGCGDMPYRAMVAEAVGEYQGIDLAGNAAATYHLCETGGTTAPAHMADIVLSTQVLEHVRDVPAYLRECYRLLTPGGTLIVTTHGSWVYHADPHDYWRWTSEGLRTAVEEQGFVVTSFTGLLGLMPLGLQTMQDGLVRKLPRWMRAGVCFVFQQAVLLADRLHSADERAKDACVYVLTARKAAGPED